MAAILHRQPLSIKQQLEELKNWHKQQQSKLNPEPLDNAKSKSEIKKVNDLNYANNYSQLRDNNDSVPHSFDEIPIKVITPNFNDLVENNVPSSELQLGSGPMIQEDKPKFKFLKKGEGIARFNMKPHKVVKKSLPKKQGLKLNKTNSKTKDQQKPELRNECSIPQTVNVDNANQIPTLHVPDLKLSFKSWKNILNSDNADTFFEKAINNHQLELFDPNTSIDSSTCSLMEKLIAVGCNKLAKDKEELRVFETLEKHMLDSSFCSTSSYVTKLMENAVVSTPDKKSTHHSHNPSNRMCLPALANDKLSEDEETDSHNLPKNRHNSSLSPTTDKGFENDSATVNETKRATNHETDVMMNNVGLKRPDTIAYWDKPENSHDVNITAESTHSFEDLQQSIHVRFAEQVDYKSFIELSQSIENSNQKEENEMLKLDENEEWRENSEDSGSCCSQCSRRCSLDNLKDVLNPPENQNQIHSPVKNDIPSESLNVNDLKTNELLDESSCQLSNEINDLPPLLVIKLKELENEIKIFREENSKIKMVREKLEKERKQIQEEKKKLQQDSKKLFKDIEEEKKKNASYFEEEKQKLAKEKLVLEKYSKSLTKNPSREERKEIQALREQLIEMKEELNKKESRWGAAQARVRNQVKVLEEDNKKLREEVEKLRREAKYWELFNPRKNGKPFNNTKLIHAISEHISKIAVNEKNQDVKCSSNEGYSSKTLMYNGSKPSAEREPKNIHSLKEDPVKNQSLLSHNKTASDSDKEIDQIHLLSAAQFEKINSFEVLPAVEKYISRELSSQTETQIDIRCEKPCAEDSPQSAIKETMDENGCVEMRFPNGNIKKINRISGSEKYIYVNGDVEEVTRDGTVKYYYSKSRIWHTTLPDGFEIVDFPDGQVEKKHINGTVEIIYPNNNQKFSYPDGSQEIIYSDGTRLKIEVNKTQILTLPNGQKEIHTEEWKRREYPDGTMKTLYPDGTTETVYSNGRVRLKDKYGNLVMDSGLTTH